MDKNTEFQRIQNFVNNMRDKREGVSNIYVFESRDMNGNVTDVKYGMNIMTNTGFNDIYKTGSSFALSDTVKLYVGSSEENIGQESNRITTPLFGGLAATNKDKSHDYSFPIMFKPGNQGNDSGLITLISRFGIVEYSDSISGFSDDYPIYEYGIGTSYNHLWTHAHIYNDAGNRTYITKKHHETMTIYIYMCLSMYEHFIMNKWNDNVFIGITKNFIMYHRMFESSINTYKRNNIIVARNSNIQHSIDDTILPEDQEAGINSIMRNTSTIAPFTLWSQEGNEHGYIDGFTYTVDGMCLINPEYLETPEVVELNNYTSGDILKASGFSDKFGKTVTAAADYSRTKCPPFTTLSNVEVYTFNYHTGLWDNPCPFMNDDNMHYSNAGLETNYALPLYYFSNGKIQTAYLFQNVQPDNAILSLNQGQEFLFATDKYWDQTTWINISNTLDIPYAAQHCKYWIAGSNKINIVPIRETHPFELLETPNGTNGYHTYSQEAFQVVHEGSKFHVDMSDYNCCIVGCKICAMSRMRGYAFETEPYNADWETYFMAAGKWLLSFRNMGNNVIKTIDVSGLNDVEPDQSVLTRTRTLEFTTTLNTYTGIYRTQSKSAGYVCLQSVTTDECVVLSVGVTISSALYQWTRSCCINGTSLIAYIPTTDTTHIHIRDMFLNTDVGADIELPSGFMPHAIFGNGDHIWFYDDTSTYHVDISSQTRDLEVCNAINFATRADSYKLELQYVNDVTLIYNTRTTNYNLSDICFITHDNPTDIRTMAAFAESGSLSVNHATCEMKYINNHTLVVLISVGGQYNISPITARSTKFYICDLGCYIKTGDANKWYKLQSDQKNPFNGIYFYGESILYNTYYLFPVVNALNIKLTGLTKTIGTFNHTKRISSKAFEIGFTNMPTWSYEVNGTGKPPGSPEPVLDINGQITGWRW